MITTEEQTKLISSPNIKQNTFSIQASAKAFNILSSGLYSDKFKAIVRELCTNASDAHVMANIADKPIKVVCPTAFNATFSVEDFGNGIDPNEFEQIYTTYFHSTKTQTNDQVGCFGLGSKSPFAYTDQFTVENKHKGVSYTYSCFKSSNGQPSVSLLAKRPTSESGLKVSFAVKNTDFYSFERAIQQVLPWFDVKPTTNVQFENPANLDKEVFTFRMSSYCGVNAKLYVRMGQVLYPATSLDLGSIFDAYRSTAVIVNLPIGSIDITPSRESIELTKRTEAELAKVKETIREYLMEGIEEINSDTTLSNFDRYKKKLKYISENSLSPSFLRVDSQYCYIDPSINVASYRRYAYRSGLSHTYNSRRVLDSVKIIIHDTKKKWKQRLYDWCEDNGISSDLFVINKDHKNDLIKLHAFEESDFNYISNMPIKNQVVVTRNKTNCTKLTYDSNKQKWNRKGVLLDKNEKDFIYILESDMEKFKCMTAEDYKELRDKGVYVVTDNQYKVLKLSTRDTDHIYEYLKKQVKDIDNKYYNLMRLELDGLKEKNNKIVTLAEKCPKSATLTKIKNLCDYRTLDDGVIADLNVIIKIMRQFNDVETTVFFKDVLDKSDASKLEFEGLVEKAVEQYPILGILVDSDKFYSVIDSVSEYINMVDNKEDK